MKMSQDEFIEFLRANNISYTFVDDYTKIDGFKVHVLSWCHLKYCNHKFTSLPNDIVFISMCDFEDSHFTYVQDDIEFVGPLCLNNNNMVLYENQPLCVYGNFYIRKMENIDIPFGTYIGASIYSMGSRYEHLHDMNIWGYVTDGGLLS